MHKTNYRPPFKTPKSGNVPVILPIKNRTDYGIGMQLSELPVIPDGTHVFEGAIYNTKTGAENQDVADKVANIAVVTTTPTNSGEVQLIGAVNSNFALLSGYDKHALGFVQVYGGHDGGWARINAFSSFGSIDDPEEQNAVNNDVNILNTDMTTVKDDVSNLKSDMTNVKTDIVTLKKEADNSFAEYSLLPDVTTAIPYHPYFCFNDDVINGKSAGIYYTDDNLTWKQVTFSGSGTTFGVSSVSPSNSGDLKEDKFIVFMFTQDLDTSIIDSSTVVVDDGVNPIVATITCPTSKTIKVEKTSGYWSIGMVRVILKAHIRNMAGDQVLNSDRIYSFNAVDNLPPVFDVDPTILSSLDTGWVTHFAMSDAENDTITVKHAITSANIMPSDGSFTIVAPVYNSESGKWELAVTDRVIGTYYHWIRLEDALNTGTNGITSEGVQVTVKNLAPVFTFTPALKSAPAQDGSWVTHFAMSDAENDTITVKHAITSANIMPSDGSFTIVAPVYNSESGKWEIAVTGQTSETTYYHWVRLEDVLNTGVNGTIASIQVVVPSPPVINIADEWGITSVKISLTDNDTDLTYTVKKSIDGGNIYTNVATGVAYSAFPYNVTGLATGTAHKIKVTDSNGLDSNVLDWTTGQNFTGTAYPSSNPNTQLIPSDSSEFVTSNGWSLAGGSTYLNTDEGHLDMAYSTSVPDVRNTNANYGSIGKGAYEVLVRAKRRIVGASPGGDLVCHFYRTSPVYDGYQQTVIPATLLIDTYQDFILTIPADVNRPTDARLRFYTGGSSGFRIDKIELREVPTTPVIKDQNFDSAGSWNILLGPGTEEICQWESATSEFRMKNLDTTAMAIKQPLQGLPTNAVLAFHTEFRIPGADISKAWGFAIDLQGSGYDSPAQEVNINVNTKNVLDAINAVTITKTKDANGDYVFKVWRRFNTQTPPASVDIRVINTNNTGFNLYLRKLQLLHTVNVA